MTIYPIALCEKLIDKYVNEYKGEATTLEEGILGLGTILLHSAEGKKTLLIKEVYLNAWNSGHTVRKYNKLPNKYLTKIKKP